MSEQEMKILARLADLTALYTESVLDGIAEGATDLRELIEREYIEKAPEGYWNITPEGLRAVNRQ